MHVVDHAEDLYQALGDTLQLLARRLDELLLDGRERAAGPDLRRLRLLTTDALLTLRSVVVADEARRYGADHLDLALQRMATGFGRSTGSTVDVRIRGELDRLPKSVADVVLELSTEALCNINRNARSTVAVLTVDAEGEVLTFDVVDDGVDLGLRQGPEWRSNVDLGLRRMRHAVDSVDGRLMVCAVRPRGLRLRATVPLPRSGT